MAKPTSQREAVSYGSTKKRATDHETGDFTSLVLPEGVSLFSFKKAGTYRLDIIPYRIKKDGVNPFAPKKGTVYPERTYYCHRAIGLNEDTYICPRKTFGKPCPVCEHTARARRDANADQQLIKDLEPKERQLWLVKDLSEPDKGIQLFDVSFHLFGKLLDAKIRNADDEDNYDRYFHLEDGLTLKVGVKDEMFNGRTFYKTEDIEFKARKEQYDPDILDKVPCLDEVLKEVEYSKLKKVFEGSEDPEEEKPAKTTKPVAADDDDDDTPPPKPKAKPAVKDDDDDDEPAPKPKPKPAAKPADDDDDDDAPVPPKKAEKPKPAVKDNDDDDDEPAVPFKVSDRVKVKDDDGDDVFGLVTKVNTEKGTVTVESRDLEKPTVYKFKDVKAAPAKADEKPKSKPAVKDDDDDDDEPAPPKKKPTGKDAKAKFADDDDDD